MTTRRRAPSASRGEYRILISHRYSSRWAGRVNKLESLNDTGEVVETTHFPVPDSMILCDLCNAEFPKESDTEIPILQHKWETGGPWTDVGTRCPDCQEGLEDLPRIMEGRRGYG